MKSLFIILTIGLFTVTHNSKKQEYKKKELIGTYISELYMIKVVYIKSALKLKRNDRYVLSKISDNSKSTSSGYWTIDQDTLILKQDNFQTGLKKIVKYPITRDNTNRIVIGNMVKE